MAALAIFGKALTSWFSALYRSRSSSTYKILKLFHFHGGSLKKVDTSRRDRARNAADN